MRKALHMLKSDDDLAQTVNYLSGVVSVFVMKQTDLVL